MQINFESNIDQLRRVYDEISEDIIPKAAQLALNKTARGVKTDAVRSISQETALKQKDIRKDIDVNLSKRYTLNASVNAATAKGRNLINFVGSSYRAPGYFNSRKRLKSGKLGKYKSKGVKARAWGRLKTYKGTFIGTGKGGNVLVFARKEGSRKLKSIQGPSARNVFKSARQKFANTRSASRRFGIEMPRAVNYRLSKIRVN